MVNELESQIEAVITNEFRFVFCATRHQDVPTRSRYVRLVDNVRDNGGNVRYHGYISLDQQCQLKFTSIFDILCVVFYRMFSSLHVSGERKF